MAETQGAAAVDADYFTNLTNRINQINYCPELQAVCAEAFKDIQALEARIAAELEKLNPLAGLLTGPSANPAAIVTWITNFINNFLTPLVKPIITFEQELTSLAAEVGKLLAAIAAAEARLVNCSVTIPISLPGVPTP